MSHTPSSSGNGTLTWVALLLVHGNKHSETSGERAEGISSGKGFGTREENDSSPSLLLLKGQNKEKETNTALNVH